MTESKLLTKSAAMLVERGFKQLASISDQSGINSTLFEKDGEKFFVGAKEYAYRGLASFQLRQVEQAVKEDHLLVFYEDQNETFNVFDPEFVSQKADVSIGKSKREKVTWKELSLEYSADLADYLRGNDSPRTLAGDNKSLGEWM